MRIDNTDCLAQLRAHCTDRRDEIASGTRDEDMAAKYVLAVPPEQQWLGLERWWRTRAAA